MADDAPASSSNSTDAAKPWFFLHIHKAGGTTVCRMAHAAKLAGAVAGGGARHEARFYGNCISKSLVDLWRSSAASRSRSRGRPLREGGAAAHNGGVDVPARRREDIDRPEFCESARTTLRRDGIQFVAWESPQVVMLHAVRGERRQDHVSL